jgi:hypothetical protein
MGSSREVIEIWHPTGDDGRGHQYESRLFVRGRRTVVIPHHQAGEERLTSRGEAG